MRSLARIALAAALVTGLGLATIGLAAAQEDGGGEAAFSHTCQQLRCYFELTDPGLEGNVSEIEWTFGPNGTTTTGNPAEHTFSEPGTYNVSVLVEGEGENATTASASGEVSVSEGEVPWSALVFGVVALVGSVGLARLT